MLSFFKKEPARPANATFKARVESFWDCYAQAAARFYQAIEKKQPASLVPEVSANVNKLVPGLAWVFGPGLNGGHSFTLSGEGVLHRQLLSLYCVSRAPKLDGWTFYPSRQAEFREGFIIEIGGQKFDPKEFWITPAINQESKKLDIVAWHPLLNHLPERERMTPLFLFLDEFLGEFGTGQWIGRIDFSDKRLADAIPLTEFPSLIEKVTADTGWQKLPPGEEFTLYSFPQPHNRFLRGDIVVGNTLNPALLNEYLRASGAPPDSLAGSGADYVFVSFDVRILPPGEESSVRGKIEDALNLALRNAQSGQLLGGAHGTRFAYIDLLLFDGPNSLAIVQDILRKQNLPAGTTINYFAKEKHRQRVIL